MEPTPRPAIVLPPRHEPHRLAFLGVALASGVYVLTFAPPPSVAASYPGWVVPAMGAGLGLHGALGLAAVAWLGRNPVFALRVEAAAMMLGTAALLLYVAALIAFVGMHNLQRSGFALLTYGLWMAANVWRALQARAHARRIEQAQESGP